MVTLRAILNMTEIAQKWRYYTERDSTLIGLYFQRQNKQSESKRD